MQSVREQRAKLAARQKWASWALIAGDDVLRNRQMEMDAEMEAEMEIEIELEKGSPLRARAHLYPEGKDP